MSEVGRDAIAVNTDQKAHDVRIERITTREPAMEDDHGIAAIERRVVRKLDWHVIPLVNTLCELLQGRAFWNHVDTFDE